MKKTGVIRLMLAVSAFLFMFGGMLQAQAGMGMGRVVVILSADSDVASAQIFINNIARGSVDRGKEVRHVVPSGSGKEAVIEVRSGGFTEQQKVVLYADRWTRVSFTLRTIRPGNITVTYASGSHDPTARVHINNQSVGNLRRGQSRTFSGYDPGEYTVQVKAGNRSAEAKVLVRSNETSSVVLTLEPPPGILEVTYEAGSHYARADLYVNGVKQTQIRRGQTWTDANLRAGTYTVRLQSGSESVEQNVAVSAGDTSRVSMRLEEPKGTLRIIYDRNSAYTTAELIINGVSQGSMKRGEVRVFQYKPGTYSVQVEHGSEGQSRNLEVRAGQTTEASFRLRGLGR